MQIVIDIKDGIYGLLKYFEGCLGLVDKKDDDVKTALMRAVVNGTPLPKGHGRLGDLDALEKLCTEHDIANSAYDNSPIIEQGHYSDGDCIWKPLFDCAPTIIEADAESEDV